MKFDPVQELNHLFTVDPAILLDNHLQHKKELVDSRGEHYVLFGAGHLGQIAVEGLRRCGIEPVAFVDNNHNKWNSIINGIPVYSPTDAIAKFKDNSIFVITVFTSDPVWRQLDNANLEIISFAELTWWYQKEFIPYYCIENPRNIHSHKSEILSAVSIWADEKSTDEFIRQVIWHATLDRSVLPVHRPQSEIYFDKEIISEFPQEILVDCGAYTGDTIAEFIQNRPSSFKKIYAIEPDPGNFSVLVNKLKSYPEEISDKISPCNFALGNKHEMVSFSASGDVRATITTSEMTIECVRLDDLLKHDNPSFIKMDIEGGEVDALRGAEELIRRSKPVLAICLYHNQNHIWEIPNLIHTIAPDYNLYFRRYSDECWESVCYAIPTSRLI
jgi:FkbM family methyltransferase